MRINDDNESINSSGAPLRLAALVQTVWRRTVICPNATIVPNTTSINYKTKLIHYLQHDPSGHATFRAAGPHTRAVLFHGIGVGSEYPGVSGL